MKDLGKKSNYVYKEPHGNSCQNVWLYDRSSKQNQSFTSTQLYTKLYQIFTKSIFKPQLLFYFDKIPKAVPFLFTKGCSSPVGHVKQSQDGNKQMHGIHFQPFHISPHSEQRMGLYTIFSLYVQDKGTF